MQVPSSVCVSPIGRPEFIVPSGFDGYTCLSFDNCFNDSLQLSEMLNRPDLAPKSDEKGTLSQYDQYQNLIKIAGSTNIGTWFTPGTNPQVKRILQNAIDTSTSLRIYYGDTDTGRSWMDEYDMFGKICRTTGSLKSPIIVAPREHGGTIILTRCIVKIVRFSKKESGEFATVLYQHPKFNLPKMEIVLNESPKYLATVLCDGKAEARFKTVAKAEKWISFMQGYSSRA
jgi:hypothetical protein